MISSDSSGSTARATRTAPTSVLSITVATSALDALEEALPEAVVDDFSRGVKANLNDDQNLIYPGIAGQFNAAAVR